MFKSLILILEIKLEQNKMIDSYKILKIINSYQLFSYLFLIMLLLLIKK